MLRFEKLLAFSLVLVPLTSTSIDAASIHEITGFRSAGRHSPYANLSLSADGSTVAGSSGGGHSFRWTIDGGIEYLDDLPGGAVVRNVLDVSADGSTMLAQGTDHAWIRWHESGEYEVISDDIPWRFWELSDDGTTAVGNRPDPTSQPPTVTGIRWHFEYGLRSIETASNIDSKYTRN
jgi:hypothetical protein